MIIKENYNIFFKSILYNYFENEDFRKSCIDIINNEIENYFLIQEEQNGDNILKLNYIEDFDKDDFKELKDKKYEDSEELHLPYNFNIKIKIFKFRF